MHRLDDRRRGLAAILDYDVLDPLVELLPFGTERLGDAVEQDVYA